MEENLGSLSIFLLFVGGCHFHDRLPLNFVFLKGGDCDLQGPML